MAELQRLPRNYEQAQEWRRAYACSRSFRDAAIISHLQLTPDDRSILHVGCGKGSLAFALYKCVRALSDDIVCIVGIDHCLTLLHEAVYQQAQLAQAADDHGMDINTAIHFDYMSAMQISTPDNLRKLRRRLPDGPKIIIADGIFDNLANPVAQTAIRNLVALQPRGGRFILGTRALPISCSSIQLLKTINQETRLVGIINLLPDAPIRKMEQDAHDDARHISGHSPIRSVEEEARSRLPRFSGQAPIRDDQNISIENIRCRFVGSLWQDFIRRSGLPHNIPNIPSLRLSPDATFFPTLPAQHRVASTSEPTISYADGSYEYAAAAADHLAPYEHRLQEEYDVQGPERVPLPTIRADLLFLLHESKGREDLDMFFNRYIYPNLPPPAADDHERHFLAAANIIFGAADQVLGNRVATEWDAFNLAPAAVLTSFQKG